MEIKIRKELRGEFDTIEINKGMAIEELVLKYAGELPYTVVAAKKDNDLVDLTETIDNPCIIEFLDIRTQACQSDLSVQSVAYLSQGCKGYSR